MNWFQRKLLRRRMKRELAQVGIEGFIAKLRKDGWKFVFSEDVTLGTRGKESFVLTVGKGSGRL